MCTVTLASIPGSDKDFVLTSNRDEAVRRETLSPNFYEEKGLKMLYPKDVLGGGTWIGISERKRTICLLNGGFEKHIPNPPYRKSRGVVVKELLAFPDVMEGIQEYDYHQIEAFTAIIVDWEKELRFLELVWDGTESHLRELDHGPHIWSSALLYSPDEISIRKKMFDDFKAVYECTPANLLEFHSSKGEGSEEGLVINRGFLKTCSITQVSRTNAEVVMWYRDLSRGEVSEHSF